MDKKYIIAFCEFLQMTRFIDKENSTMYKYNYEMKKGGAVIFDEAGVHRGSKTKLHKNMVLRYLYVKA